MSFSGKVEVSQNFSCRFKSDLSFSDYSKFTQKNKDNVSIGINLKRIDQNLKIKLTWSWSFFPNKFDWIVFIFTFLVLLCLTFYFWLVKIGFSTWSIWVAPRYTETIFWLATLILTSCTPILHVLWLIVFLITIKLELSKGVRLNYFFYLLLPNLKLTYVIRSFN